MLRCDPGDFGTPREPLWSLLYRYWFWGWLFHDVNVGDALRRHASRRHNVAMRAWLPTYMGRWCLSSAALLVVAVPVERVSAAQHAAALLYTGAVLAALVTFVTLAIWTFLRRDAAI
jgi:hypothetical protein